MGKDLKGRELGKGITQRKDGRYQARFINRCDIDFQRKYLIVSHTMVYYSKNGWYVHELHDTKTKNGIRKIPLTKRAISALKAQKVQKTQYVCPER